MRAFHVASGRPAAVTRDCGLTNEDVDGWKGRSGAAADAEPGRRSLGGSARDSSVRSRCVIVVQEFEAARPARRLHASLFASLHVRLPSINQSRTISSSTDSRDSFSFPDTYYPATAWRSTAFTAVCLSVSEQHNSQSYGWIFTKFWRIGTLWTRDDLINVGTLRLWLWVKVRVSTLWRRYAL